MERKFREVRKVVFARLEGDEFLTLLVDKDNNVVQTMEPRDVEEGETYELDLGVSIPVLAHQLKQI